MYIKPYVENENNYIDLNVLFKLSSRMNFREVKVRLHKCAMSKGYYFDFHIDFHLTLKGNYFLSNLF